MNKPIALIFQQETSSSGRIGPHLRTLDREAITVYPLQGEPLPSPETIGGAVIFGGPLSVNDEHLDGIRDQLAWVPDVVRAEVPFLGICLGGQMLAKSMGGTVGPHPVGLSQIGYTEISPTTQSDGFLNAPHRFYQWHSEGFTLPTGSTHLGTCPTYPNQAFCLNAKTYGVQFHPEVNREMMDSWLSEASEQLKFPGAQTRDVQFSHAEEWMDRIDEWMMGFMKNLFN